MPLSIALCLNETLYSRFKNGQPVLAYDSEEEKKVLDQADAVVVQYATAAWGARSDFQNALHFIDERRLDGSEQQFVVVGKVPKDLPKNEEDYRYVLEDPGVINIEVPQAWDTKDVEVLLREKNAVLFDLNQEEREALFQDLRQTQYMREGNIQSLQHKVDRLFTDAARDEEALDEVLRIMRIAYARVRSWGIVEGLPRVPEQVLERYRSKDAQGGLDGAVEAWFNSLRKMVRANREAKAEDIDDTPLGGIVYISQSDSDKEGLKNRLLEYNRKRLGLFCPVSSMEEGLEKAESLDGKPVSIITDFRYRGEDGRIAALNGYNILSRIREKHADWQYILLTNYPVQDNEELPVEDWMEVFPKRKVLDSESFAFRFISKVIVSHMKQQQQKNDWPFELKAKDDKAWKRQYDIFRNSSDYDAEERRIGEEAFDRICDLLSEKGICSLPAHGKALHVEEGQYNAKKELSEGEKEEQVQEHFCNLLLTRRVYLGLFQLELEDKLDGHSRSGIRRLYRHDLNRLIAGCAYAKVHPIAEEGDRPDGKKLSNYFGLLRLRMKLDYRSKTARKMHISQDEERWLRKYDKKLKALI